MDKRYISDFQIIGSSVKKLKLQNSFVVLTDDDSIRRTIDISHFITSVENVDGGKTLSGLLTLNVKLNVTADKKKYSLDMAIEGCFEASCEMGEEKFREMLQVNGVTSLYSIARGFVQSITAQTLVSGSILLPMVNVLAYSRDLDKEKEEQKTSQNNKE